MLNKLETLFLASIFSFVLLSSFAFSASGSINCSPCEINNCVCSIDQCSSGIIRIYKASICKYPAYEHEFSNYKFQWNIISTGTYYLRVFCSDGTSTDCQQVAVTAGTTTVKSTTTTASAKCRSNSDCTGGKVCVSGDCVTKKSDYTWLLALILLIVVIAVFAFLFLRRKPAKRTFEEIYRKWGK